MKQNFGFDCLSADFTVTNGKVVPDNKISIVFTAKQGLVQDLLNL